MWPWTCARNSPRFVRGDFRRASPERGRFRDYRKTAEIHLVMHYDNERRERPRSLSPDEPEPVTPATESFDSERDFLQSWQEELLDRTWKRSPRRNRLTRPPSYSGLRTSICPRRKWLST